MATSSISSLSQTATGSTQKSAATMVQTYDQFLTLLTTQLKNQDPLSPMDSNEFTAQLVQFTQVEQQISINDKLDQMVEQAATNQTLYAAGFIDKTIEATGNYVVLDTTSSDSGKFTVGLSADAPKSTAVIKNADGQVVRTLTFDGKKGRNELTWDGKNTTGTTQDNGAYTVTVNAVDTDGKAVDVAIATVGKVTEVVVDSSGATALSMSGAQVGLDKVLQIKKSS